MEGNSAAAEKSQVMPSNQLLLSSLRFVCDIQNIPRVESKARARAPGIPVPLEDLQHRRLDDSPASLGIFSDVGGAALGLVWNLELYHGGLLLPLVVLAVRRGRVGARGQIQRSA